MSTVKGGIVFCRDLYTNPVNHRKSALPPKKPTSPLYSKENVTLC